MNTLCILIDAFNDPEVGWIVRHRENQDRESSETREKSDGIDPEIYYLFLYKLCIV